MGYVAQILDKMHADAFLPSSPRAEYVLYFDSDTFLPRPLLPAYLFNVSTRADARPHVMDGGDGGNGGRNGGRNDGSSSSKNHGVNAGSGGGAKGFSGNDGSRWPGDLGGATVRYHALMPAMMWWTVGAAHESFWRSSTAETLALPYDRARLSFMVRGGGLIFPTSVFAPLRSYLSSTHNASVFTYAATKFAGKLGGTSGSGSGKRSIFSEYEVMGAYLYYIHNEFGADRAGGAGGAGGGGGGSTAAYEYPLRDRSRDAAAGVPTPSSIAWNIAHDRHGVAKWTYDSPNFPIMQSYTWGHGGLGDEGRLVYECILGGGLVGPPAPATGVVRKNHSTECSIQVFLKGLREPPRCPWTWGKEQGGCRVERANGEKEGF